MTTRKTPKILGCKEQILRAETVAEVDMLLVTFRSATNPKPSAKSLERMKRAAKRRLAQLEEQNAKEIKK